MDTMKQEPVQIVTILPMVVWVSGKQAGRRTWRNRTRRAPLAPHQPSNQAMTDQTKTARSIFETIIKLLEQGAPVAMILDENSPTLDAIRDWLASPSPSVEGVTDAALKAWLGNPDNYSTKDEATAPAASLREQEDAARYRHLRECNSGSLVIVHITGTGDDDQVVLTEQDADDAIDADAQRLGREKGEAS